MQGNPSLNRFMRKNLYAMKRSYGIPIKVCLILSSTTDYLSGEKVVIKQVFKVRRAPVLPYSMKRAVDQTISIISADKKFVQGGSYDAARRDVIVDAKDLPPGIELRPEDYVIINNERWDILQADRYEFSSAWLLTVKLLPGSRAFDEVDVLVTTDAQLAQELQPWGTNDVPGYLLSGLALGPDVSAIKVGRKLQSSEMNLAQNANATVE